MKSHIVSIGISQHQNAGDNLQYADKDAQEFYDLFSQNLPELGYKKLLLNSEATLGQIRSAIGAELKEAISPEDVFFFFYSGHGAIGQDKSSPDTALNYLVPFDATYDFENSAVSIEYLKEVFEELPSKANFIFVDSCFSGSMAKNSKGFHVPKTKTYKSVKSFANTTIGNGTLIFTACKDDQLSIEDPEYKNGLFTYELFSELQKDREGELYDALHIFSPVAERVEARAKTKWGHDQTPTFSGKVEGKMSFPVFKKRLAITPDILAVPRYIELTQASFPTAQVEISDKVRERLVNDTLKLVTEAKKDKEFGDVNYERYCGKVLKKLKERWEELFIENGASVENIPGTVAKLEGESFQFMLLGGITAAFGSTNQMVIYSKYAGSILSWTQNRSGLTALISTPEIVLANIIYLVGVLGLASEKLDPLGILVNTKIDDLRDYTAPPRSILSYWHIFYCDALSGYSNKVHDHIREVLNSFDWLPELVPSIEGKVEDFQHQTNLLLCTWMSLTGGRLWPDFARFYPQRVMPLVRKIKYDDAYRKKIASIFGIKDIEVKSVFRDSVAKYQKDGLGGSYWWQSIEANDFFTDEEKKKR